MPEHFARLNAVQIFQLAAIVLILPIQYFITQKSSEGHRQYQLEKFLTHIQSSLSNVFNNSFVRWCYEKLAINDVDGKTQEHIIPETSMKSKEKSKENFGLSLTPRTYRPPVILYKVGQVVRHKKRGFLGVVVGWDERAKAPVDWLKKVRPENKAEWNNSPNYAVLVDIRSVNSNAPQVGYVVQENLELVTNTRILHPLLDSYFENYESDRYVMRPWLENVYPRDNR